MKPEDVKKLLEDYRKEFPNLPSWYSPDMPSFFSHETMKIMNPKIKEAMEMNFPRKHYGEDILVFEAWGLRSLLEQAAMIGYYLAKEEKEEKTNT
jgi:hypothetical protein